MKNLDEYETCVCLSIFKMIIYDNIRMNNKEYKNIRF